MPGDVTAISPFRHVIIRAIQSCRLFIIMHVFFSFKYVPSDLIIYSLLQKRVIKRAFMGPDYLGERVNVNKHGGKRRGIFQRA